ncbi:DUF6941 family protein [Nocardioides lacus]|uniref:DUF6941 family protein n=1 Tax=Nocardioides sp. BP30 TaxID=3036374 RepID=UPI00406C1EC3
MKGILILSDAAQATDGKVSALGVGWRDTVSPTPPMGLVVLIDCPWDQTNTKHNAHIELVDTDGKLVSFQQGPMGQPIPAIAMDVQIETGRPPGLPPGSPQRVSLGVNIGPLPLPPGQYEFRLSIDDEAMDSWLSSFIVRANPGPPAFIPKR